MLDITLTPDYRITSDGNQLIVHERHTVDPTKAPNWERRLAEDPTLDPSPRETWRELGYYGLRTDSLLLAIDLVIIRTAARSDIGTLGELAEHIRKSSRTIAEAFRTHISRTEHGELAAQAVAEG